MKIACLGWGSLIWRPEELKIQNNWFEDGPILPIEFTRISTDNRVTLIIDEAAKPVKTLWALMTTDSIEEAKTSLRNRELIKEKNSSLIHSIGQMEDGESPVSKTIKQWLIEKNIDYAIWTGLSFSKKTRNIRPDINQIIQHLRNIDTSEFKNSEEYIRKTPRQIDTEYRRQIELEFGWTPIN